MVCLAENQFTLRGWGPPGTLQGNLREERVSRHLLKGSNCLHGRINPNIGSVWIPTQSGGVPDGPDWPGGGQLLVQAPSQ